MLLIQEIEYIEPIMVFAKLRSQGALLLDSAAYCSQSQYSFIGLDPFQILTCKNNSVQLGKQQLDLDPFTVLENELQKFQLPHQDSLPPFQGGVAGMLGYELAGYLENIQQAPIDDMGFPQVILGFYDIVIAFDHLAQKSWIFSSGFPASQPKKRAIRAQERLAWVVALIKQCPPLEKSYFSPPLSPMEGIKSPLTSTFSQSSYERAVAKVIEYIRAGDIFEANISQRFSLEIEQKFNLFDLYCRLRHINPCPFAAFFQYDQYIVASASLERFLQVHNHCVQARPIKGTSPRHPDPYKDQLFKQQLFASEKNKAENIMIVDLMRNDLSRVCLPHSISVPQLCGVESYPTLHHLVSVIKGQMQPGKSLIDLLKATFPGGSVTGAPKIRSMEIIAEIEPTVRGPYCGSMGYLAFNGEMDLSITIRTFVSNQRILSFHAGGAVTVDSDPYQEYQETLLKAKALSCALGF